MASKILPTQQCSVTGSVEDHLVEHKVPVAWTRQQDTDRNETAISVLGDATDDHLAMMKSMHSSTPLPEGQSSQQGQNSQQAQTGEPPIKAEKKTPAELADEERLAFEPLSALRKFQDIEMENKRHGVALLKIAFTNEVSEALKEQNMFGSQAAFAFFSALALTQ